MTVSGRACRLTPSAADIMAFITPVFHIWMYLREWTLCRPSPSNILHTLPCCFVVRHQRVEATGESGVDKVIDVIKSTVSLIAAVAEPG